MFHSRTFNNKINKLHERAVNIRRTTSQTVTIHHKNLQVLAIELYKIHHGLASELVNDIFKNRNVMYNFRKHSAFETRNIKSAYYGSETISFIGPKYGNFYQVTLSFQKILTSSNQILNLQNLKTAHAVCTGYILQT